MKLKIIAKNGSIQDIDELPKDSVNIKDSNYFDNQNFLDNFISYGVGKSRRFSCHSKNKPELKLDEKMRSCISLS